MNAKTVESIAELLLASRPDTPVKVRLLRDILPGSSPSELKQALADLKEHPEYARLQKVRVIRSPGPMNDTAITRLKPSLRERGDVFRAAAKIGLTEKDPVVAPLIKAVASYQKELCRLREWNDSSRINHDRFSQFHKMQRIPGTLAFISPGDPVVVDARKRDVAQVKAHYEAGDCSTEYEDSILPKIYGRGWFTEGALAVHRSMKYCTTDYSSIYDACVFRVVGTGADELPKDICLKYCDDMLNRLRFIKGTTPTQERIISGDYDRADLFGRSLAGHIFMIHDHMSFPCWRVAVNPFVDWLWSRQREDGFWDFGAPNNAVGHACRLRLSRTWQGSRRAHDWTLHLLLILQAYYRKKSG